MMDNREFSNANDDSQRELDLDLYVRVLWRERRTVITSVLVTLTLAVVYLFMATPEYSSNALLKLNPAASQQVGWTEVTALMDPGKDPVSTALEVLVSRQIIGQVVDQLHLDILAQPRYFPVFGAPLSRVFDLFDDDPSDLRASFLGMSRWAWGGERITVEQFQVPGFFEGTDFTLIKGKGGSYQLLDSENNVIVSGTLLTPSEGQLELPNGKYEAISLLVTELVGHEGTKFSVNRQPRADAIKKLQDSLEAVESAANSGVIHLSWSSPSATLTADVLNAVANSFVDQDVNAKRSRLDLMLAFIDSQLPVVRTNLSQAEDEYNKYHNESGSVDINLEASTLLAQLAQLEGQISDLALLQIDYQQRYTAQHPSRVALENKLSQLRQDKARLSARIATLPGNELQSVNVQKEVEIASQTYMLLQQRQQEFSVARAGLVGDFSIVDTAFVPLEIDILVYIIIPVLAVSLGGFVGLVLVLFSKRNIEAVESLEDLSRFRPAILAKVVRAGEKKRLLARIPFLAATFTRAARDGIGASNLPTDGLSDLRVSLAYSDTFRESGLVLLAALGPEPGLAFIADKISRLFAGSGKSVVVVDTDLRDGRLHESVSMAAEPGLADVISGRTDLSKALQKIELQIGECASNGPMALLSAGRRPDDPANMLMSDGFMNTIESVKQRFDIVVVAAPPLLGTADALPVIAAVGGSTMLVIRVGRNVPADIEFAISKCANQGRQVDGLILYDEPGRSH